MDGIFDIRGNRPAKRIQQVFYKESEKRDSRTLEEWQEKELLAVWRATNEERARDGKGPVRIGAVKDAERMARGHIDYSMKWAFYCESLVYAD